MPRKSINDRPPDSRPGERGREKRRATGGEGRRVEIGGRKWPDPTRYGDWEKNGRCIDF